MRRLVILSIVMVGLSFFGVSAKQGEQRSERIELLQQEKKRLQAEMEGMLARAIVTDLSPKERMRLKDEMSHKMARLNHVLYRLGERSFWQHYRTQLIILAALTVLGGGGATAWWLSQRNSSSSESKKPTTSPVPVTVSVSEQNTSLDVHDHKDLKTLKVAFDKEFPVTNRDRSYSDDQILGRSVRKSLAVRSLEYGDKARGNDLITRKKLDKKPVAETEVIRTESPVEQEDASQEQPTSPSGAKGLRDNLDTQSPAVIGLGLEPATTTTPQRRKLDDEFTKVAGKQGATLKYGSGMFNQAGVLSGGKTDEMAAHAAALGVIGFSPVQRPTGQKSSPAGSPDQSGSPELDKLMREYERLQERNTEERSFDLSEMDS